MPCIRLQLPGVKKNVQQCHNTSVTTHLPTLILVTQFIRYLVLCQPIQCIQFAKELWLELCHWFLIAWQPPKRTSWMNSHKTFISATANLHAKPFLKQISAMAQLICPTGLPVRSVVLCFCWFVYHNLMTVGISWMMHWLPKDTKLTWAKYLKPLKPCPALMPGLGWTNIGNCQIRTPTPCKLKNLLLKCWLWLMNACHDKKAMDGNCQHFTIPCTSWVTCASMENQKKQTQRWESAITKCLPNA